MNVREQIDYVLRQPAIADAPKRVLVVGASTGYGLASRIVAAFGGKAATLGVFFERPAENDRTATAGWYNSAAFESSAHTVGLYAKSVNGDAFSDEIKQQTIALIEADLRHIDLLIYSLASPRRTHPKTGVTRSSVLKPVGSPFSAKSLDPDSGIVSEITVDPAREEEIADTIAVMGGEDWSLWVDALQAAGVLAPGFTTAAYSYIGPEITWPVYRDGTIGHAKKHLEATAASLHARLAPMGGRAFVSVNKALVTQASSAIPVVPLYISLLYKVMKDKGLHEGCIEQIHRLFATQLYNGVTPALDPQGLIRLDDWEMRADVQQAVAHLWPLVTSENLDVLADINGYREDFLKLFGFGLPQVDYAQDVNPDVSLDLPSSLISG